MRRQSFDLLAIENGVSLHEGNFGFNLRALLVGAGGEVAAVIVTLNIFLLGQTKRNSGLTKLDAMFALVRKDPLNFFC